MNHFGRLAMEHLRMHRPTEFASIDDPVEFFGTVGEEIQATVTSRRDEILGPIREGETHEAYRLRGYQALRTAEELTLREHHLLQATDDETDAEWDPAMTRYLDELHRINQEFRNPT